MKKRPVIGIVSARHDIGRILMQYTTSCHYLEQVEAAGGLPIQLPLIPGMGDEEMNTYISLCDGFLFPGGADFDSSWYGEELLPYLSHGAGELDMASQTAGIMLVRKAVLSGKPVLGICLGCQLINVAMGGSLIQDIPGQVSTNITHATAAEQLEDRWKLVHSVKLLNNSLIQKISQADEIMVNSFHHQAVNRLASGFMVTAWAKDGIAEAIESGDGKVLGVQWHPENMAHGGISYAKRMFCWLIENAE